MNIENPLQTQAKPGVDRAAIRLEDLAAILGCPVGDFPAECIGTFQRVNPRFRSLTPEERDTHILGILKRLDENKMARTPPQNLQAFEAGWNENYEECLRKGISAETLKPKYVKPFPFIRYRGSYIVPEDPFLFDHLLSFLIIYAFLKYLPSAESIYEFGCGTGRYLYTLSTLFPGKRLIGLDWTESSQKILALMAAAGGNIEGQRFDMLHPDPKVALPPRTAVFTVGAMEQLGERFHPFLDSLLTNRPDIVLHFEPIDAFYDEDRFLDYLGLMYHRRRGYLSGYWAALRRLGQEGKIEILEGRPLQIGDPCQSISFIAWRSMERETHSGG